MKIIVIVLLVFFIADVNCQTDECVTNFLTNNLDAATSIATDCPDLVINNYAIIIMC